jgi:carbon storage regulator
VKDIVGTADGSAWCHREPEQLKEETVLVLSRKVGESIVIDSDIVVTVLSISGERIRLGISAPDYRRIRRSELEEIAPDGSAARD